MGEVERKADRYIVILMLQYGLLGKKVA